MTKANDPQAPSAEGWDCHVHVFDADAPALQGHYRPAHRPLEEIEALAACHGIRHLVIVQPSVYGTDNSLLLRALASGQGRHRGVAVIDPAVTDRQLDQLHAAGVRGARFNLVSPAGRIDRLGDQQALMGALRSLAPRLHERGWHVQWYVHASMLPQLADWQAATGLRFVLDHLAGLGADLAVNDPAWGAAQRLADAGAWIKLSGWYRLGAQAPYAALQPSIARAAAMFGGHCIWGSDWPHTSFKPEHMPPYAMTLSTAVDALGADALRAVLVDQARALYLDTP